jgi:hypothetical protein
MEGDQTRCVRPFAAAQMDGRIAMDSGARVPGVVQPTFGGKDARGGRTAVC